MKNAIDCTVCIIKMDTYNNGVQFEVAASKKAAMRWIKENMDYSDDVLQSLKENDCYEYDDGKRPWSVSILDSVKVIK